MSGGGDLIKDKWTAADGTAWSSAIWTTVRNVRGSADPPTTTGNTGRMTTVDGVECHVVAALADDYADVDISFTFRAVTTGGTWPPDSGMNPYIGWRVGTNVSSGDPVDDGYALFIAPLRGRIVLLKINSFDVVAVVDNVPIDDFAPHWYRIRSAGDQHRVKWWHTEGAEPPTWNMTATDDTYTTGRVLLGLYSNDGTNAVECEWDWFRMEELLPLPPGIFLPEGETVALQVGAQPVLQCFVGSVEVPVPTP